MVCPECGNPLVASDPNVPLRIGGLLFLVAIDVILSPFNHLLSLVGSVNLLRHPGLGFANQAGNGLEFSGIQFYLGFMTVSSILLLILSVWLLILFFRRKSQFPRLMILYNAAVFLREVVQAVLLWRGGGGLAPQPIEVLFSLAVPVVWILYFMRSNRVKDTFVL